MSATACAWVLVPAMHKRGFTLVELLITIGIVLGLAGLAIIPQRLAREQPRAQAQAFTAVFDTARGLARANDGAGSGALVTVRANGDGTQIVATLVNRPLPGYAAPAALPGYPPERLSLPITLTGSTSFSIAIAPSGALDIVPAALAAGAAPIASAPGCGSSGTPYITLIFGSGARAVALRLSCTDGTAAFTAIGI